jgi:hypothetical protein
MLIALKPPVLKIETNTVEKRSSTTTESLAVLARAGLLTG